MEFKLNGRTYYKLKCEKCGNEFTRRKDEFKKHFANCNNRVLCSNCMRARKYEDTNKKVCSKCHKEKSITEFYKRASSLRSYCSQCKECMNAYNKKWIKNNELKVKERTKKYREDNKEKFKELHQSWKDTHKKEINEYKRNYYHNNKNNLLYSFEIRTRHLILKAFKRKGYKKTSRTQEILGCDYETFIKHLLQTFKNNYGYEWDRIEKVHIDHIIPLATAKTEEEVLKLNNYKNLQLLKELDNLHKSNKLYWSIK